MTQSARGSLIEAVANAGVGLAVSVALVYLLRAVGLWDAHPLAVSVAFLIASVARGYVIRRAVEWWRR